MPNETRPFLWRFLPRAVREFFLDSGLEDIKEITERYGLSPESVDELDIIQQEILFGYEPLDKLENLIRTRLGYDQTLARKVVVDLLEKRFLPLDSYLSATAFRLYVSLGGNPTVLNVAPIDAEGVKAKQVMERQEEFLKKRAIEKKEIGKQVPPPLPRGGAEELGGGVVDSKPVPVEELGGGVVDSKPVPVEELGGGVVDSKPVPASVVTTMQDFDSALNKAEPIHKGEKPLDPSHEIAPPLPVVSKLEKSVTSLDTLVKSDIADANIAQSLQNAGPKAPRSIEHPKIDEVIRKLSLTFSSSELQKRFRVLVGARLSGVRRPEDFEAALFRAVDQGGLGFTAPAVSRIVEAVEQEIQDKADTALSKMKEERQAFVVARQETYGVGKTGESLKTDAGQIKPTAVQEKVVRNEVKPVMSEASVVLEKTPSGKTPVVDIVPPRRLSGPVEELSLMSLEDFRRIPGNVSNAVTSISDDLDNLAKQDPGLYIRGVAAWRMSPLVKEYRRILALALQDGVRIDDVLASPQKNPQGVKIEEMNALRGFHSALRSNRS